MSLEVGMGGSAGDVTTSRTPRPRPHNAGLHRTVTRLAGPAILVVGFVALHLSVQGSVPSGPDGGNWLALARSMLGQEVMSAGVTYPPIFPGMLAVMTSVLSPLTALTTVALVSKLALVLACWWCLRPAGQVPALIGALLLGVAGYQLEAFAWGGYPQLLATGFALLATGLACRYATGRGARFRTLGLIALASAATFLTHLFVAAVLLLALPLSVGLSRLLTRREQRGRPLPLLAPPVVAMLVPASFVLLPWFLGFGSEIEPVLNPLRLSVPFMVWSTFRESPVPWVVIAVLAVVSPWFARRAGDQSRVVALGLAWVITGLAIFAVTGEQRALMFLQLGIVVSGIPVAHSLLRDWSRSRLSRLALSSLAITLGGWLILGGVVSYARATDWYRVIEPADIEMLDWIESASQPGDLMLASRGHNGNPLGWWIEGYSGRPTLTAVDARFLAFPDEVEQARTAARILSQSPETAETQLRELAIHFVVVDRRGSQGDWYTPDEVGTMEIAAESATLLVLELDGD